MLDDKFAHDFAAEWVAAWNSHDLDRVLSHYTDDFTMSSPLIIELMGEPSGMLRGKAAVRSYWEKAMARIPDLHFELLHVLIGAQSLVIYYRNQAGRLAAEMLRFDTASSGDKAVEGVAHYGTATP